MAKLCAVKEEKLGGYLLILRRHSIEWRYLLPALFEFVGQFGTSQALAVGLIGVQYLIAVQGGLA